MSHASKFVPIGVLTCIVLVAAALLFQAAWSDSANFDESAHIPAGYSYVRFLDYRLNPEHPPIVKVLAGIPLLLLQPNFPTDHAGWKTDVNGQWKTGAAFMYDSGNDADQIVRWSRMGPILLTLLLIILTYLWAAELMGRSFALIPALLVGLSPTVLAHGHFVTTDVGAALGISLATYRFLKYLETPSRRNLFFAGLAFGIAELMKFSAVLLAPFFILLIFFYAFAKNMGGVRTFMKRLLGSAWSLLKIFIIGAVVIYLVYGFFTLNYPLDRQIHDTETIFQNFRGGPTPVGEQCEFLRCFADVDIALSKHYLTRPLAEYILGLIMVIWRTEGGNSAYYFGEISAKGWPSYFPFVFITKETLGSIVLIAVAFFMAFKNTIASAVRNRLDIIRPLREYLNLNFTEFSMILFTAIYWASSITSPLNIGVRHLIPTFPFIYILTAGVWRRWLMQFPAITAQTFFEYVGRYIKLLFTVSMKHSVFALLMLFFLLESFGSRPYYLSHFNLLVGGTSEGYRYATDSNYDWGQDLNRLKLWMDAHPEVDKIAVDYFGGGRPTYTLGDCSKNSQARNLPRSQAELAVRGSCAEHWWSARGNPADEGIHYLAVSVNTLSGAFATLAPDQPRKPEDEYRWLRELRPVKSGIGSLPKPDDRAGTSIFIYHL